ncbi:uncharacterized protein LOC142325044 isoform X4 [Lycorma delicatula]|uniref:uncharacterized protein LOC142325044 isoform X4 n=1 Tax=Lycorma delicatula TaxID=130591 RepID=UPI003F513430
MDSLHSFSVKPEIMPRRKSNLGRRTRRTEGSRRRLSNMTEEERASVRERNRLSTIHLRNVESAERRAARLEDARLRARQSRSAAKDLVRSQRNERLSKNTIPKKKKKRKNERSKKEKKRLYMQDKRKNLQGLVEKIYVKIEPQDLILDDYKDGDGDNNYDGMEDVGKEYDSEISTKELVEKIYVKIEPQDLIHDDYEDDDNYNRMEEEANVNDGEITTKSDLNTNDDIKKHNTIRNKKKYTCTVCSKSLTRPYDLKRHMKIHTGLKPYSCDICGKVFAEGSSLHKHMRVHTGEKPYKCKYCFIRFKQSGHLQDHLLRHTGEKPHSCSLCDKSFRVKKSLKYHVRLHHITDD